jgi:S-adenosylmethionine:tRNA ribosyltransferase-isomerase
MDLSRFDYHLPPELIAQEPVEPRDASRLLVVDRGRGSRDDRRFGDLPALLQPGDCLIANDSKVVPARLLAQREPGGQPVELLMLRALTATRWEALARPGRRCRAGTRLLLGDGVARAIVAGTTAAGGARVIDIEAPWPVRDLLARHGLPPLPPYIARHATPKPEDYERYQTVYARSDGSIAAPTAGLHFTPELLSALDRRGIERHYLTLHIGPATFRPLRVGRIEDHRMDAEEVEIPEETARAVNRAKEAGRRVIAVGTTTTRALEWAAADGHVSAARGAADLFIYPGHSFTVIDGLITNFHLPRSTLLLLVSAFLGREPLLDAYRHAVTERYRFYSYGDAMLVA